MTTSAKSTVSSLAFSLVLLLGVLAGGTAGAAEDTGSIDVTLENDRVAQTDRHYTNGIRLSYLSAADSGPQVLLDLADRVPVFASDSRIHVGYTLGQSMFTPDTTGSRALVEGDRPYAGWLYGGAALVAEGQDQLQTLELDIGVVGPYAFAEETQNTWHDIIHVSRAEGWDNQLDNEPGVVLFYEHTWRKGREITRDGLGIDVLPHAGGALGNVFTHAAAGVTMRFGDDLANDYGPPRIRPALPGSTLLRPQDLFGWYLFAGFEGRAVLRNIFLDGNSFSDSHSVDKSFLVADMQIGAAVTLGRVRLAYTQVYRTREFAKQDRPDRFGAISLSVKF